MGILDCLKEYENLAEDVFGGSDHRLLKKIFLKMGRMDYK